MDQLGLERLSSIRRHYHQDLKRRVIYQVYTLGMKNTAVAILLNMALHVVQHCLKTWREIGEVCRDRGGLGRAPLMQRDAVRVSPWLLLLHLSPDGPQLMLALIEHSPDIYLDEIQEELYTQHNIDVSLVTIWRTLRRLGMSSKCVSWL